MHRLLHVLHPMPAALALALIPAACVRQSDYAALRQENQQLQIRLDKTGEQLQLAQSELAAQQLKITQLSSTTEQLQRNQKELEQPRADPQVLTADLEKFRVQRRAAMVGKKYPVLNLEDGKVLHEAEITAVDAEKVAFRHAEGFLRVPLTMASDNLRWEACYDPSEAQKAARERMIRETRELEAKLAVQAAPIPEVSLNPPTANVVTVLQQKLAAQRQQLNADYQMLAAKNPKVLKESLWNHANPEDSPVLNSLSGSRAVLGLGALQLQRHSILALQHQLQDMATTGR